MFSRVSHQPLKQKRVQSETEPLWRLAQVYDTDVPGRAGGLDTALAQHSPTAKCQTGPKAALSHIL